MTTQNTHEIYRQVDATIRYMKHRQGLDNATFCDNELSVELVTDNIRYRHIYVIAPIRIYWAVRQKLDYPHWLHWKRDYR